MKRFLHSITALCVPVLLLGALSCTGIAPTHEVRLVDSLNRAAYALRYRDVAQAERLAAEADKAAQLYPAGKAEACNMLGLCALMRMDYPEAAACFGRVERLTRNEVELLVADVNLMKVCQRMARNKEFYDYRNRALQRMKRISEEGEALADLHERQRLAYARSEFHIVSAIYHYYLQQRAQARECIRLAEADEAIQSDSAQWLYARYIRGATAQEGTPATHDSRLAQFDLLFATWQQSARLGLVYLEGNAAQGVANLMTSARTFDFFLEHRRHELSQFGHATDSLLPLHIGQLALECFTRYGNDYQTAGAYVTLARYLNDHGRYADAIGQLAKAQACLGNSQRQQLVPDCLSRLNEQLSVSYAGLEMKPQSDSCRNIYLDIMERTRQDKEMESRYEALERESRQLNGMLAALLAGFAGVAGFFFVFNRTSRRRSRQQLLRLRHMLELCRNITGAIPTDAQSGDEVESTLLQAVKPQIDTLFGPGEVAIRQKRLHFGRRLSRDEQAMLRVINPYVEWAIDNGQTSVTLDEQRRQMEEQRLMHERHITENKRQNVAKRACMSVVNGIRPFVDRILNEVNKLKQADGRTDRKGQLQYIDELASTINEYNDILAYWIQMRQGTLSLHIESFPLDELFTLLYKGKRAFALKSQQLTVIPTDLCVKADKALTLFMLNTLAENARKYTPRGGEIRIEATETDGGEGVEISVSDNGNGLSAEDVARINEGKLYDSSRIGWDTCPHPDELKRQKGSGFGLMNCKGIMEKYRKTSTLFGHCRFGVESTPGKGSRFHFTLPKGARRQAVVTAWLMGSLACPTANAQPLQPLDWSERNEAQAEALLDTASLYADKAYFSNIDGRYEQTLAYADSALHYLNLHLEQTGGLQTDAPLPVMTLTGEGDAAELTWWDAPFDSDFHVILDVRNEAAVAFLALKQWDAYRYNNRAYTTLYKLLGEDQSLEEYCRRLERSTDNKTVAIVLGILLMVSLLTGYYLIYYRKRLIIRWNMEQVLEINQRLYAASQVSLPEAGDGSTPERSEEELLHDIPRRMVADTLDAMNGLLPTERIGVAVCNGQGDQQEGALWPPTEEPERQWPDIVAQCLAQDKPLEAGAELAFPLHIEQEGGNRRIGVLYLKLREECSHETDRLLLQMVANYWGVVLYNAVVKLAGKFRDIESALDEARRASWEENKLHVQNQVIDNCLSTIKHETIYYPNKIKQLVDKLLHEPAATPDGVRESICTIGELIEYYKGIYLLLSRCAERQMERVGFRRQRLSVARLTAKAQAFCAKAGQQASVGLDVTIAEGTTEVWGDLDLVDYLLECLIASILPGEQGGTLLHLHVARDGKGFVRFSLTDPQHSRPQAELDTWFHPSMQRIRQLAHGRFPGTEYLIGKQIIRQHDELSGHPGCRINAQPALPQGYSIWFTLPEAEPPTRHVNSTI